MKRLFFTVVGLGLLSAQPTLAQSASPLTGFYVGLAGGAAFFSDQDVDVDVGDLNDVADVEITHDTGYRFGGFIGYQVDTNIRVQADLSYIYADAENTFTIGTTEIVTDQELSILSGTAGVYFDLWPVSVFVPYVGAGIGLSQIEITNDDLDNVNDVEQTALTVFAEAGVPFNVTPTFSVVPTVRYTWYQTEEEDNDEVAFGVLQLERATIGKDLYSTDVMLAARFNF
jgi:opacity protein-like surface antigen